MTSKQADAVQMLYKMAAERAKQEEIVNRECDTLEGATALMKKWGESRLVDAIYRESKSRAIKALGL